ncbi:TetR/AcrR family transcriptional regulator [Streptomyces malaysiensis]|uniref:TetR family transcriptional regulator n=1 Tax=Streptomyces malaysiensis TaxID=92644 RepID=A0A7X6AWS3_STRMQ|nr:TetR/AcrR family transcriptional regulator [Streptomyces malaysiensis]NIY64267.1 TetR family transcriptional regulator [Streptomyces malaysiensis]
MKSSPTLRDVSRQAVRSQIARTAEQLFVTKGFEATTVDEIAAAVGMSQRSFFRYFASKDEVVLDNYERMSDEYVEHLRSRPPAEPEWDTLHSVFSLVVDQFADDDRRSHGLAIQNIVESSPALLAGYLEKMDRAQERLTDELVSRARERGPQHECDQLLLRATVGAAFACLQACVSHVVRTGDAGNLSSRLDRVMTSLRPHGRA